MRAMASRTRKWQKLQDDSNTLDKILTLLLIFFANQQLQFLKQANGAIGILPHQLERFSISSLWNFAPNVANNDNNNDNNNNNNNNNNQTASRLKPTNVRLSNFKCGHQIRPMSLKMASNGRYEYHALSGRIVGGREASISDFPWIVSLQRERDFWFGFHAYYHSCGGTLITPSWILTAAHCLYNRDEPLRVVAGTDNMNFLYRAQIRNVNQQFYHPWFNISTYDNDIALIKVEKPFNLETTFSTIGLVCLEPDTPILAYDIATICGFGARAFHQKARSHLYETEIAIIDQKTCNYSFGNSITKNMICAGGMIENKRDACSGDSGGPLLMQDIDDGHTVQIGIVSFGNDCAVKNYPGIYTRVSKYYQWILEHIDEPLAGP